MKSSIRKFLLVNLLLALTLTVIIAGISRYFLDRGDVNNNLDGLLTQVGTVFQALVSNAIDNGHSFASIQESLDNVHDKTVPLYTKTADERPFLSKYMFQVWDDHNHVLLHCKSAPAYQPVTIKNGLSDTVINGKACRVFSIYDPKLHLTFAVAEHYGTRELLIRRITKDDMLIMLVIYPLFGLFIWFIVGRELLSIKNVANHVAERAADHLEPFDLKAVPLEIQPLVDELNKLFLRLKQAFEREQRFAADAAHELRTPLAALKTQAQVALKTTDPRERQAQLQNVIAGVDRCTHVIQQLLTLCRMSPETTVLEDYTEIDLAKLAAEVIGQLAPSAIDKQIEIELIAQEPTCMLQGNATALHALIRNLVDNAIRYTPENGNIKVFVQSKEDQVLLRVVDNGTGIPADLRSRAFERFYRVLGTNVQGSGLGLAIVLQIVKLHRGSVKLGAPENGIGLEVEVELPRLFVA